MSAAVKACNKALTIENTGSVCNESMGPTAMLIAAPPGATWPASDLADFTAFILEKLHAPKAQRWYVLFGPGIPIRKITNNKEADVIFTADDGTQIFIRYGVLNRTFTTTEGGLCFAKALQSLNKSGYSFIEVDNAAQIMSRINSDKTYAALKTTFVYSPSIDLGDFKNPSMTNFAISIKPEEYIRNGVIFQMDDTSILDLTGLLNAVITDAGASSATKLKIGVQTECDDDDLVASVGAPLATIGNFVITKKSDGTVVTASAAAIVGGHIELTGVYTSAAVYVVTPTGADVWFTNGVEGYEGIQGVEITIP